MNFISEPLALVALAVFAVGYVFVILEEQLHLRKSVPMLLAAAVIWVCVGVTLGHVGAGEHVGEQFRHVLIEYAELLLFLLCAMTFVNTMEERGVFHALRDRLLRGGFDLRAIFWITGTMAFFISPIADNLTTALVMGAVAITVGKGRPAFITCACANIVVAANAGGAYSPFGDITTLMVWQKGHLEFGQFFALFVPSLVNWLIPAAIMALSIAKERPAAPEGAAAKVKPGGLVVVGLLLGTIAGTVALHQWMHLPPVFGMMAGLGVLKLYGFLLERRLEHAAHADDKLRGDVVGSGVNEAGDVAATAVTGQTRDSMDVFKQMERLEWDTLMFFYGVMVAIGGLGALGYLAAGANTIYGANGMGTTAANVAVGIASALIDNIPIMYAVLSMNPEMSDAQWQLVSLTAGVGGSLLSVGSAAGVALMGQARGAYTFFSHLKWSWAIALGYAASIAVHLVINGE